MGTYGLDPLHHQLQKARREIEILSFILELEVNSNWIFDDKGAIVGSYSPFCTTMFRTSIPLPKLNFASSQ